MNRDICLIVVLMLFFLAPAVSAQSQWQSLNTGLTNADIVSISICPGNSELICAASATAAYLSHNQGQVWDEIFSLRAQTGKINFISFSPDGPKTIYLATSKGVYATADQGASWRKIFSRPNESANLVNWIAYDFTDQKALYVGTANGLYASYDLGLSWTKLNRGLPEAGVRTIVVHPLDPQILYLANSYGLYRSKDYGKTWQRLYLTSFRAAEDTEEDPELANENQGLINSIAIDSQELNSVFIATGRGVYSSLDQGESWQKLSDSGLRDDYINYIILAENLNYTLYAAGSDGVYGFSPEPDHWVQIYQGNKAFQAHSLAILRQSQQLFAATNSGVLKIKQPQRQKLAEPEPIKRLLAEIAPGEPTIQQVQQAALRYAEVVRPERIKTLRRNAKLKALLPDFDIDYDKTVTYDSGSDRYYIGPYDWGFSFSWDIGDLVFNEQVRLIDSNARLMIQLRDDILNEITRLYYARLKLKSELVRKSPQADLEALGRALRLAELTANIDALTGGFFSAHLKKR
ncbi:WD40/YVTN/BNR-like repeat-containing protein [Candidatus Omnitrophota bacterium]